MIPNHKKEIFDKAFKIHNVVSNSVVESIVIDRKFDIPDWFYEYLDENILLNLLKYIKSMEKIGSKILFDNFEIFYRKCGKCKFIHNNTFVERLIDNNLIEYLWNINDKVVYKTIKHMLNAFCEPDFLVFIIHKLHHTKEDIPVEYIKLYILKSLQDRVPIYKRNRFNKEYYNDIAIILNRLLSDISTIYPVTYLDRVFSTIYKNYKNIMNTAHFDSVCIWYWGTKLNCYWTKTNESSIWMETIKSLNGDYIPDDVTLTELDHYVKIKMENPRYILNPKVGTLKEYKLSRIASDLILNSIKLGCIENIYAINWDINVIDKQHIIATFTKNVEKIKDYTLMYKLTQYEPSLEEYKIYLENSGDLASILPAMEKWELNNTHDFILYTLLYAKKEDIIKILLGEIKSESLNGILTLEYIIDQYILSSSNNALKEKLTDIII